MFLQRTRNRGGPATHYHAMPIRDVSAGNTQNQPKIPGTMHWSVTRCALAGALLTALGCTGSVGDGATGGSSGMMPPPGAGGTSPSGGTGGSAGVAPMTGGSAGATGGVGGGGGTGAVAPTGGTGGVGGGVGGAAGMTACTSQTPPRAPLRRITRFEYNNSVRDLLDLDVTARPADALPGEEAGTGFGNDADAQSSSRSLIDGYRTIAQQLATQVTATPAAVAKTMRCDPAVDGEDACRQRFIPEHLTRAFRRPPEAEDLTAYEAAFATGVMLGGNYASGVKAVVERSLQAAQFLYRVEFGETVDAAKNLARPTGYEMATRLAFLIWGAAPDDLALAAARDGRLADAAGVLAEAQRMLTDGRAKDSLRQFHAMLFGTGGLDNLERDAEFYPSFKPGMGRLFRQETELFLEDVIWNGTGDLATVFTAPYTFVNGPLATFYGIPNVSGDAFQKVSVDTTKRSGLLTQASILTLTTPGSRTDPVVRGKWAYTKLFCGTIDDPPMNIPELPDPVPGQSVRDRLAMHREDPSCNGCHSMMDPLGFGFEHFDGVGQWRDMDNGVAVDASGEVPDTDVMGPFNGAIELSQKVAQSRDARACYAGRYLTFAYGRAITEADACSRSTLDNAFEQAQGNIKALMLAVTQTEGFLLRPLATP
jgi:hypothetical protein